MRSFAALLLCAAAAMSETTRFEISDRGKPAGELEISREAGKETATCREVFESWEGFSWNRTAVEQKAAWTVESRDDGVEWKSGEALRCTIEGRSATLRMPGFEKSLELPGDGPLFVGVDFATFACAAASPAGPVRFLDPRSLRLESARVVAVGPASMRNGCETMTADHVRIEFEGMWIDAWLSAGDPVLVRASNTGHEARSGAWKDWIVVEAPDGVVESEATVASGAVRLAGTFACPGGDGPFPAVVLLSGSGPDGRDGRVAGHEFLNRIAWELARAGIASLRLDDRGVGKSGGDFADTTLPSLTADALAAADWLRARKDVSKVAYLGHSEGALVATVCGARDPRAAAVFRLAGPARTLDVVLEEQGLAQNELGGVGIEIYSEMCRFHGLVRRATTDEIEDGGRRIHVAWLRSHFSHDPAAAALDVKCPMDIFQGLADKQVAPYHADLLEKALAGREGVAFHRFKNLDHSFRPDEPPFGSFRRALDADFLRELVAAAVKRLKS